MWGERERERRHRRGAARPGAIETDLRGGPFFLSYTVVRVYILCPLRVGLIAARSDPIETFE